MMRVRWAGSILIVALFISTMASAGESSIRFVRRGGNIELGFENRNVVVPVELLSAHLKTITVLHDWHFENEREDAAFRTAVTSPGSSRMTVRLAVLKRYEKEKTKVSSLIAFDKSLRRVSNAVASALIKRLVTLVATTSHSQAGQKNLTEINRTILNYFDDFLKAGPVHITIPAGTTTYEILRSYFRPAPKLKFTEIRAGQFLMGKSRDLTIVPKPFELQTNELTQDEWFQVVGANPSFFSSTQDCPEDYVVIRGVNLCPNYPVETFRPAEADIFMRIMSFRDPQRKYRLPTNVEWEYAARAGTRTTYTFGSSDDGLDEFAWSLRNANLRSHRVNLKTANPWGFRDMSGNVWEFVADDRVFKGEPADNKGITIRGGSWIDRPSVLGNAVESRIPVSWTCYDVGIRVAR